MREVRPILETRYRDKESTRQRVSTQIGRHSTGALVQPEVLLLVRESNGIFHRYNDKCKLDHDEWTGSWKVSKVLRRCLSLEVAMEGRQRRRRRVATYAAMRLHPRRVGFRYSMADEYSQHTWSADLGHAKPPYDVRSLYILADRKKVSSSSGVTKWVYRERQFIVAISDCLAEQDLLKSFVPLLLDLFHALWNLYYPIRDGSVACTSSETLHCPLACRGPLFIPYWYLSREALRRPSPLRTGVRRLGEILESGL